MNLFKVTWAGTIGTAGEIFAYSRWFSDTVTAVGTPTELADALADSVANMLAQPVTSSSPFPVLGDAFPGEVLWTHMFVRAINPATGLQLGDTVERVLVANGGGLDAQALPNQVALAVSIRKGTTGRRRWNRFYLPPLVIGATGGGDHVMVNVLQAISDWMVAEQTALLANTIPFTMVRYSKAGAQFDPPDATYIGSRVDVQRRRANKEVEVRTSDPLPQP